MADAVLSQGAQSRAPAFTQDQKLPDPARRLVLQGVAALAAAAAPGAAMAMASPPATVEPTDGELIGAFFAACVVAQVRPVKFDFGGQAGMRISLLDLGRFEIEAWRSLRAAEHKIKARPSAYAALMALLPEIAATRSIPRKWMGPGRYQLAGLNYERWVWCRLSKHEGEIDVLIREGRGFLMRVSFRAFDRHAIRFGLGRLA